MPSAHLTCIPDQFRKCSRFPMVGPQIMAWLAWSSFLPGWPANSKFPGKLRANNGEILQLSGMHEDEGDEGTKPS